MTPTPHREFTWYMAGHGLYFFAMGVQNVLFAWLLAVHLHESAERIGIAQMLLNLPTLCLVLFGGAVADRHDCRRLLMRLQFVIALPPAVLLALDATDRLDFSSMCAYALAQGTLGAFLIPARDSLLNRVGASNLQRAVVTVMLVQFSAQLFGLSLGGTAGRVGAWPLLAAQVSAMLLAIVSSYHLNPAPPVPRESTTRHLADIGDGLREAARSPAIAPVVIYMFLMGIVTIGVYLVALPLLVRDVYSGGSAMLAGLNVSFMIGVALVSVLLMRFGPVRRQGRAMLLAGICSMSVVLTLRTAPPEWAAYACFFVWGMGAGVAMSMSRALVQAAAPPAHRARILAVYQLGFMGGAPIGSFVNGYLAKLFGLLDAMLIPAAGTAVIVFGAMLLSSLWRLEPATVPAE
ncbi:MAG TPA: MFS transporter [Candidatus Cybelea sp.]|nr:MFS transporter [Candidatus Cybelea sp.]